MKFVMLFLCFFWTGVVFSTNHEPFWVISSNSPSPAQIALDLRKNLLDAIVSDKNQDQDHLVGELIYSILTSRPNETRRSVDFAQYVEKYLDFSNSSECSEKKKKQIEHIWMYAWIQVLDEIMIGSRYPDQELSALPQVENQTFQREYTLWLRDLIKGEYAGDLKKLESAYPLESSLQFYYEWHGTWVFYYESYKGSANDDSSQAEPSKICDEYMKFFMCSTILKSLFESDKAYEGKSLDPQDLEKYRFLMDILKKECENESWRCDYDFVSSLNFLRNPEILKCKDFNTCPFAPAA